MTSRTRNVGSVSQTIFRALDKMAVGSGLGTRLRACWVLSGHFVAAIWLPTRLVLVYSLVPIPTSGRQPSAASAMFAEVGAGYETNPPSASSPLFTWLANHISVTNYLEGELFRSQTGDRSFTYERQLLFYSLGTFYRLAS